ncbi:hypothetical protein PRZ48_011454 [Zasmidium cellare]|uniref:Uncharacterized protein n=1 Tax=Zasmidium cellare TaxID=395010 RepID=A0ABR0E6Y5_ZASCE|nr:hypothetical protein PRZ48_011454 [Zasmidium cellare]
MIKFMLTIVTALVAIGGALAAPAVSTNVNPDEHDGVRIPDHIDSVDPNYANCSSGVAMLGNGGARRSWYIHIGREYADGNGCDAIRDTLTRKAKEGNVAFDESSYKCMDDGNGDTYIKFDAGGVFSPGDSGYIIDGLQEMYPMVPFKQDGICAVDSSPGRTRSVPDYSKTLNIRDGPIDHNTALCSYSSVTRTGGMELGMDKCEARVGRDYINGLGCEPISQTLESMIPDGITKYSCVDDGYGYTQLAFNVWNARIIHYEINMALQTAYSDVPFVLEHICG